MTGKSDPSIGPADWYRERSSQPGFVPDSAQQNAIQRLQRLWEELLQFKAYRSRPLMKTFGRRAPPRGLYLYGGVGRGKSLLMDAFYNCVPYRRKRRVHFHDFMREVHQALARHKGETDPLVPVAAAIAARTRLLCFDEFHVNDIADAMILARLLTGMFEGGVICVMTSNYPPDELYRNGLQRERFLPAIELLKRHLDPVRVDAGTDYRLRTLERVRGYLVPAGPDTEAELARIFAAVCGHVDHVAKIEVEGRDIPVRGVGSEAVWFTFDHLCGGPRSQNDYLDIARRFRHVVLSAVPRLGPDRESEARRFTWLIDILYDRRVKLVMSAAVAPEELYLVGTRADEFARTVSRLREMQTAEYLAATPLADASPESSARPRV